MATPILIDGTFLANAVQTGAQSHSFAAGLANGSLFLTYESLDGTPTPVWTIEGQVMSGAGTSLPSPFAMQPNGALGQPYATVTLLADGNLLVVWADQHDAQDRAIRGRVYSGTGTQVGVDFNLNATTANDQAFPAITALKGGGFVAVWQDNSGLGTDTSGYGIKAVTYDAAYAQGTEFLVNAPTTVNGVPVDHTAGDQIDPHVTALANGGFAITWLDTGPIPGANPAKFVERGRIYDATGTAVSGEIALDVTRGSMPATGEVVAQVVGLTGGDVAFVWVSHEIAGGDVAGASIRTAIYSATGVLKHAEVQVNTTTAGDQTEPTAVALQDGRFMVAWVDASAGAGNEVIRAQVINADGSLSFSEFVAHAAGFTGGSAPNLTQMADGRIFLSWTNPDAGFDGSQSAIAGQYIDPRTAGINLTGTTGADQYFGSAYADIIRGAGDNDTLTGGAGNDTLIGGTGNDTLTGGVGNDVYVIDSAADVIIETVGGGTADRVMSTVSFTLAADYSIEVLGTASTTGVTAIDLTGNSLAQSITGNAGVNRLIGGGGGDKLFGLAGNDTLNGGIGNDILNGGAGNDVYYVDNAGDIIIETGGNGTADRVMSAVSFTLAASHNIEFLATASATGVTAINLTGNSLAQAITGNAGANRLLGGGGADTLNGLAGNDTLNGGTGSDVLNGGAGNDVYYVDNAGDTIIETGGNGTGDRVMSAISFSLAAGHNIEFLVTTSSTGTTAIDLTGNSLDQAITGNAGVNHLDGGGGADTLKGLAGADVLNGGSGNDVLNGGAGADSFVFNTALGATNTDVIVGYSVTDDQMQLDHAVFAALAAGPLAADAFAANLTGLAGDASDRIIYKTDTGGLYYDADGQGGNASVLFATVTANLAGMGNGEFTIL